MILKAVKKWNVDLNKSFMIDDKKIDVIATQRSNLRFIKKNIIYLEK